MVAEPIPQAAGDRRTEREALLCCARTQMDARTADRFAALCARGLDGDYLIEEALVQGVLPLVHHHLNAACPGALSEGVRDLLWDHARVMARTNLLLMGEMARLLTLFAASNIPLISFKGPVLNAMAYGHPLLRDFTDLDFLVHREDLGRANQVLLANGYVRRTPASPAEEAACLANGIHFEYEGHDPRLRVDMHWAVAGTEYRLDRDTGPLWARSQEASVNGRPVRTFSDEDTLLSLCIHGSRHDWQQLKHICDVAEFVKAHPDLEWAALLDRAARARGERMLNLGLILARDVLATPLPDSVAARIERDAAANRLAALVRDLLFRTGDTAADANLHRHRLRLGLREGWRARLQYCVGLFIPRDYDREQLPLPSVLSAALYLARPGRLVWKALRSAGRRRCSPKPG